jgi:putative salt-induced outer membrane protein YdiY
MQRFLALAILMVLVAPGAAQLKDVDFKVQDKPGKFDDNALFTMPSGPPEVKEGVPLWSGQVEFGANGSQGNSDVYCMRIGAAALRQSEGNIFSADLNYVLNRQQSTTTADRAIFNARDEVFFKGSPWGMFLAGQVEYDDFRDFDFRAAVHTGFAYQLFRTDSGMLRGRMGAGASRVFGKTDDQWVPEGLIGADYFQKTWMNQCIVASFDYYPDLGRFDQFRLRLRAAYEIALDPACRLRLRVGVQNRYDSNPGTSLPNDVDYFTSLLYKF